MKKRFFLLIFVSFLFTVRAQDTIYPYEPGQIFESESNFKYSPMNSIQVCGNVDYMHDSGYHNGYIRLWPVIVSDRMVTGLAISGWYTENPAHLYPGEPMKIWGVIVTIDSNDYSHPTFYFTRPRILNQVDGANYNYCYTTFFPTNCYFGVHYTTECPDKVEIDTVFGASHFYFDNPLILNDTFWVGVLACDAQDYNNILCIDSPIMKQCTQYQWDSIPALSYQFDNRDLDNLIWLEHHRFNIERPFICPVFTLPDTDTFGCPEVEGFGFAGMNAGSPTFVWDTASEHEVHQVAYGPYDAPLESLRIAETNARFLELFDNSLRPDIYYQARVRARRHHRCPIHDTVMWTAWSAPVYFYTGDHMPDTTHQPEGIDAPGEVLPFAIVPNPSRSGARQVVEIGRQVPLQGLTLTLHDAAGHEVLRMEVKEHRFALPASLPAGVYVATLASPQGTAVRRVVVES